MAQASDERMQILRMLQEGRITAEQASDLLAALEEPAAPAEAPRLQGQAQFLRVMVQEDGETKVNINIPLGLVRALGHLVPKNALKVGEGDDARTIDLEAVIRAVEEGANGRIVEIHDEDTRVEIVVD